MRGQSLPAGMRRVTLSYFIAGPLAVIAQRKRDFLSVTIY